ncbi:hypothetical protein B0H16DRAFT_1509845 [Mycena metata]|uniref:PPPDE domain-containing protein n=1 Tax=Mycena metata TaxID=1033252 RepID=A0AAD7JZR1_9AGAR|nr:hypothetical protein B0H16DRAFT_1509845 [Mycena metata]
MLNTIPQDTCMHTLKFVDLVRDASENERRIPIVAMDAYKNTEATDFLLNKSFVKCSHQFIVVEIETEPRIYARVDFQGDLPFEDQPIAHSILLSFDRASITLGATSFARFSNGKPGGPTLDAFASLLEIMHRRTHRYDVFSRNCIWFTDSILYATGRRYADHWRADYIAPVGLGRYIDGSIGATRAAAEICTNGDPVGSFIVDTSSQVLKGMQWLFSLPAGESRIRYPDEEIGEILEEWNNKKDL